MIRLEVDESRCIGEGICVEFCPFSIFELAPRDGKLVAVVDGVEACTACYTCIGQCPEDAIALYTTEERTGHGELR